jgi:hypothetical protein
MLLRAQIQSRSQNTRPISNCFSDPGIVFHEMDQCRETEEASMCPTHHHQLIKNGGLDAQGGAS